MRFVQVRALPSSTSSISVANFTLDLRQFVEKTKRKQHIIVRKVLMDISIRLVERSPVGNPELWAINRNRGQRKLRAPAGYVGGRFRGNWQYATRGAGVPSLPIDEIDPEGSKTLSRISTGIGTDPAGYIHVLVNNLPYAESLENGWSKQAPAGMVGLTVVEFEGLVKSAANEVVDQ